MARLLALWFWLWRDGVTGAPWACMFCGSVGPRAFFAWILCDWRHPNKLHPCKREDAQRQGDMFIGEAA